MANASSHLVVAVFFTQIPETLLSHGVQLHGEKEGNIRDSFQDYFYRLITRKLVVKHVIEVEVLIF